MRKISSEAYLLVTLQNLDSRLNSLEGREHSLEDALKSRHSSLESLEGVFHEKHECLKELRKKKLELELLIGESEELLQRHEDEKYRVKTQHEFEALEKEIKMLEATKSSYEDQLLDAMEEEEELDALMPTLEGQLEKERATWAHQQSQYAKESDEIRAEKEQLSRDRETLSAQINQSTYERYVQLHQARGGLAVVPVEDGVCIGCNMKVSSSLISQIRHEEIVHCENCGRMLYLVPKSGKNDTK